MVDVEGTATGYVPGGAAVCLEDNFTRTEALEWGTADTGQIWDSSVIASVNGSAGHLERPDAGVRGIILQFYPDPFDCPDLAYPVSYLWKWRCSSAAAVSQLRLYLSVSTGVNIHTGLNSFDFDSGINTGSFGFGADQWFWCRAEVSASHRAAKVWADGDPEPAGWGADDPFGITFSALNTGMEIATTPSGGYGELDYVKVSGEGTEAPVSVVSTFEVPVGTGWVAG